MLSQTNQPLSQSSSETFLSQDEDSDSGPDLEAAVTQTGTEWADAMEESSDIIPESSHQQNPEGQVKWSTVVTEKSHR